MMMLDTILIDMYIRSNSWQSLHGYLSRKHANVVM